MVAAPMVSADSAMKVMWSGGTESDGTPTAFADPEAAGASKCDQQVSNPGSGVVGYAYLGDHNGGDPGDYELYCMFAGTNGEDDFPLHANGSSVGGARRCADGASADQGSQTCSFPEPRPDPDKNNNNCPNPTGDTNPILLLTGEKIQIEVDSEGTSAGTLPIRRWYSNRRLSTLGEFGGSLWQLERYTVWLSTNYNLLTGTLLPVEECLAGAWVKRNGVWWSVSDCGNPANGHLNPRAEISFWHGKRVAFESTSGSGIWVGAPDSKTALSERWNGSVLLGWAFSNAKDETYLFDTNGVLEAIHSRNGAVETLHYDLTVAEGGDDNATTLDRIDDHLGHSVIFTHGDGDKKLTAITDANGETFSYSYNSLADGAYHILDKVTYPDGDTDPMNNPFRQYHYEEAYSTIYMALTGISDERGVRFASWTYEGLRATSSSHGASGGGIDEVTIDYSGMLSPTAANGSVSIANALGKVTKYHYTTKHNVRRLTRVEGEVSIHPVDSSVGCELADQYYSYDSNGFKDVVVDWESKAVDYDHDSQGREVRREEGLTATVAAGSSMTITTSATPEARVITTDWHPNFRLPTRITEPDRVIDMNYDCANARMVSRVEYDPTSAPTYAAPPNCNP